MARTSNLSHVSFADLRRELEYRGVVFRQMGDRFLMVSIKELNALQKRHGTGQTGIGVNHDREE